MSLKTYLIVYVMLATFTFGWVANADPKPLPVAANTAQYWMNKNVVAEQVYSAFLCSLVWPLYLIYKTGAYIKESGR